MNEETIMRLLHIASKGKEHYFKNIEKCSEKTGISKQAIDVLLHLDATKEGRFACDIVSGRGLSKSYVSKAISQLLKEQLIRIETDSNDHRYQHIILEKRAEEIIDYMKKEHDKLLKKTLHNISKEDLDVFLKVVDTMLDNVYEEDGLND